MKQIIGVKKGMTQIYDDSGNVVPVTVVEASPCMVTQIKTKENDGYNAIQVGFGKKKKISKPLEGQLRGSKGARLQELKVEDPAAFQVGQEIKVEIFSAGDIISVSGKTIGKGFQGTIKRWHHHRGSMTHGSKFHRIPGSIGSGTTPGRVYKGRRMSGRMGGGSATVKNLKIVAVDVQKNLLLIKGAVPGPTGNRIVITRIKGS